MLPSSGEQCHVLWLGAAAGSVLPYGPRGYVPSFLSRQEYDSAMPTKWDRVWNFGGVLRSRPLHRLWNIERGSYTHPLWWRHIQENVPGTWKNLECFMSLPNPESHPWIENFGIPPPWWRHIWENVRGTKKIPSSSPLYRLWGLGKFRSILLLRI